MRIAWKNEIDSLTAGSILVSSDVAGQDESNLLDTRLSTKWITDSTTSQSVVFSFAAAIEVDTIGVLGHNITSACTVTVEANTTASWVTPAYSTTMTVYSSGPLIKFTAATQTYRYWRLTFAGQGDLEIGRIWLGEYLTVSPSSLLNFRVEIQNSDNIAYGRGNQKYASEGSQWKTIELQFPKTAYTMIASLLEMYAYTGQWRSMIFCNFDTLRDYPIVEPIYCSLTRPFQANHEDRQRYSYSLALREDL